MLTAVTQTIDIIGGVWTWISFNVDDPTDRSIQTVLASLNWEDGDRIQAAGLGLSTSYYDDGDFIQWFPDDFTVR